MEFRGLHALEFCTFRLIFHTVAYRCLSLDHKDYYQILGVSRNASQAQIKHAYRKLVSKYHPDISREPDAEARFHDIGEAWATLGNHKKRAEYDAQQEFTNDPSRAFFQADNQSANTPFEDLIRSIFGAETPVSSLALPGTLNRFDVDAARPNQHYKLLITLEEAWTGASRQLRLADGRAIMVKIPSGVRPGQELRLRSQTDSSNDLYLKIELLPHALYEVAGNDVTLRLPVAPWEAGLGDKITVPTLSGPVNLSIPANSQQGTKLRLKGLGLATGDQIVILEIINPPIKSHADRQQLLAMKQHFQFQPRPMRS
jgi:curved DNA-binding protein